MSANKPVESDYGDGSSTDREHTGSLEEKRASSESAEGGEPDTSFGEPLRVSVSRGTSRFQSIQRTYSKPLSLEQEESMVEGKGSAFDLTTWLTGRQQQQGPPFTTRVGLVFSELSVYGDSVADKHIATLATPVWKALKWVRHGFGVRGLFGKKDEQRRLLNKMSGVVEDGEMLLVLGRPGSGCSTLLRVLGNQRKSYRRIEGDVSYGGLTPAEIARSYRGQVAYNAEEDQHHPTLTVRQTLEFAIQCKMPSRRMLKDREGYRRELMDTLLDMYGLANCADTIVGNAFIRGCSGGERRRVTIAEQTAAGAAVDIYDGATKGLDSSSALDYVRSLRVTTDVLRKSTVVSIYQASEDIYALFDKVMVIDEGRQLYFGPASQAVAYFEALGVQKPARQTTADFLSSVTQLDERRLVPGFAGKAPQTAADFERAWLASAQSRDVRAGVDAFRAQLAEDNRGHEIRAFVDSTKMGGGSSRLRRRSPYTSTMAFQSAQLFRREAAIMWGNRAALTFKLCYQLVFAAIVGALFNQLPETSNGAFLRSGVLFFALLFNSLTAQSEIPAACSGRLVSYKQKALAMYHPGLLAPVQTVLDLPYMVVSITLFSVILYFAAGLERSAGHFFAFVLFLLAACLCLTALFRLIGNASPSLDVAHTASGVILLLSIITNGYLVPPAQMGWQLRWFYWALNSLHYGYNTLMSLEFRNLRLACTGASLVPSGAGFDDVAHQVCTLQGARPGAATVLGRDYLLAGYGIDVGDMWWEFVVVLAYFVVFVAAMALCMEFLEFGNTGYTTLVHKRHKPAVEQHSDDEEERDYVRSFAAPSDAQLLAGTTFTWRDFNYTVPVKGGHRQLLNDVAGFVRPGQMTALMGASGAGKTTLLDALSQRKTIGALDGEVLMDGAPLARSFRRATGYAEQLDVHAPLATVRELLRFSARLRQPAAVPDADKDAYVERVLRLLDMAPIADCLVGDPDAGAGISLEQRKRLTIGVELVARPKMLFLDEPTSGLAADAAQRIVRILRRLASAERQTILCTIHQPAALLFTEFDRLLLLVRGGHVVYHGDIGEDARTLIAYFERNGAPKCPPTANPAEYILDVAGKPGARVDWPRVWRESNERQAVLAEIARINALKHRAGADRAEPGADRTYARSVAYQTRLVFARMLLMQWRNTEYQLTRIALQVICAVVVGLAYLRLGDGLADMSNKMMALFFVAVLGILATNNVMPQYLRDRRVYGRESSTNQYGWQAFGLSVVFAEWPFAVLANTLFVVILYWMVGLNPASDRVGYFYIVYIVFGFFSLSLGQMIASFSANEFIAALIAPIPGALLTLVAGATTPYPSMPKFFSSWLYWLSPHRYLLEGLIANDLHGARVHCNPDELYTFEPPANSTCRDYAGDWVKSAIGYIDNLDATSACKYCPYSVGDEFVSTFSWSYDNRWRNFGILFAFIAFNIIFTIAMVRIYKVNKR